MSVLMSLDFLRGSTGLDMVWWSNETPRYSFKPAHELLASCDAFRILIAGSNLMQKSGRCLLEIIKDIC